MRLLGLDYGEKRIGVAVSDLSAKIAFPREVLKNEGDNTLIYLSALCESEGIAKIVLGQSLDYSGKPNLVQKKIEQFKNDLEKKTKLTVHYQNEVLTSKEASRSTNKSLLDASAAAIILQSYLDRL